MNMGIVKSDGTPVIYSSLGLMLEAVNLGLLPLREACLTTLLVLVKIDLGATQH